MREKKYKPTSLRISPELYERAKQAGEQRKWSTHQTLIEAFKIGIRKFELERQEQSNETEPVT